MRCSPVSAGCKNCWHLAMCKRHAANPRLPADVRAARNGGPPILLTDELDAPLRLRKPARIGVQFMGDLFHEDVPFEFIDKVFATMALCPQHTFQVLTKRPGRMVEYFRTTSPGDMPQADDPHSRDTAIGWAARDIVLERRRASGGKTLDDHIEAAEITHNYRAYLNNCHPDGSQGGAYPLRNVSLGISAEDQETYEDRVGWLLKCPAAMYVVSLEPLLESIDLDGRSDPRRPGVQHWDYLNPKTGHVRRAPDWVIVGAETGPGARPMNPDDARSIRNQCQASGIPFFLKQMSGGEPIPADLQIREYPT